MDLDFVRIGSMRGSRPRVPIDYPAFVAGITAAQAVLPAARIGATPAAAADRAVPPADALAMLFEGKGKWAHAAVLLGGSFHPAAACLLAGKGA